MYENVRAQDNVGNSIFSENILDFRRKTNKQNYWKLCVYIQKEKA